MIHLKSIFSLFLILITSIVYCQDWEGTQFSISGSNGNCLYRGHEETLSYTITPPENVEVDGVGSGTERYRIISISTLPFTTRIWDLNNRHSLIKSDAPADVAIVFDGEATNSFQLLYENEWREDEVVLKIETYIEYTRIEKYLDKGVLKERVDDTQIELVDATLRLPLKDYLLSPPSIRVNGELVDDLHLNLLNGDDCMIYTLSSGLAVGADRHEWVIPDGFTLVSPPESLTSTSIQIRPDFGLRGEGLQTFEDIQFRAIQSCKGQNIRTVSLPCSILRPTISASKASICNGSITSLSIAPFSTDVSINWEVDESKIEIVSGQNDRSVQLKAKGDSRAYTLVILTVTTDCGTAVSRKRIWVGRPSTPVVSPSGYPTVNIPYQSFQNFQILNYDSGEGASTYTWSLIPNDLTMQLYNNTKSCRIWADKTGGFNYYVKHQNACGWSDVSGGAINISGGSSGGSGSGDGGSEGGIMWRSRDGDAAEAIVAIQAAPNPATDWIKLSVEDESGKALFIPDLETTWLDVQGRPVLQTQGTQINVATLDLPAGLYFLNVKTSKGFVSTTVLIQ